MTIIHATENEYTELRYKCVSIVVVIVPERYFSG